MKKLLWIIPLGLAVLCAVAVGVFYLNQGYSRLLNLFAQTDRTGMMQPGSYTHEDGTTLVYRIYAPERAEALPLVLFLHGGGELGDDNRAHTRRNSIMQTLLNDQNRAEFPAVALAPQCPADRRWAGDYNVTAALMGLLEQTIATYNIDPARVYVAGISMGGRGVWNLLAEHPDFFAAAVPVCGWGEPETAYRFSHVPIWVFHGARDGVIAAQYSRDMVEALEQAGSTNVRYTEYPRDSHAVWQRVWREAELFPWMFAQVRG